MFDGETVLQGPITYRSTVTDDSGSSSVTAILQCQQGKDVYVEAKEAHSFPYNVNSAGLTSFTGLRLCSTDCDDYVAFSAVLTRNVTANIIVAFDHILINHGNAYNPSDGVFTCPDEKLYLFTWSAVAVYGNLDMSMFVDSAERKYHYVQPTLSSSSSHGTSGTCSQSTIIRCSTGSSVYLRAWPSSASKILLGDYSVFSGYRVPGQ